MRVAVAVFVQRVNHIVNATEYQKVIYDARQVVNHITGMANETERGRGVDIADEGMMPCS